MEKFVFVRNMDETTPSCRIVYEYLWKGKPVHIGILKNGNGLKFFRLPFRYVSCSYYAGRWDYNFVPGLSELTYDELSAIRDEIEDIMKFTDLLSDDLRKKGVDI